MFDDLHNSTDLIPKLRQRLILAPRSCEGQQKILLRLIS
jgi:hypothetical protein